MKQVETAAVVAFKADLDRMADYLLAAGYDIKRTHLTEAGARFKGARDWRTLRAELSHDSGQAIAGPALNVPQIGDKELAVYFSSNGDGPAFCWCVIDQDWLNTFFKLRARVTSSELEAVESSQLCATWLDDSQHYRMGLERIIVEDAYFRFTAVPRHSDEEAESDYIYIDKFLDDVLEAVRQGHSVLFYHDDSLGTDEDTARDCFYTHSRMIAMDEFFAGRNDDVSFDDLVEALQKGDDVATVKAEYGYATPEWLVKQLTQLADAKEEELLAKAGLALHAE